MKKLFVTLMIVVGFAMQALAYDFQSGDLLYSIISTDPPQVSVDGHVDGQAAQGELVIPASVEHQGVNYEVKSIKKEAFWNCSGLTGELVLPESITEIGEMAFGRCTGFVGELHLPHSLTKVKYGAFFECSGFTGTLTIPDSVNELGDTDDMYYFNFSIYLGAFMGCSGFNRLVLPESLKVIGVACFADCTNLAGQLVLPEGLEKIKYGAFANCGGFMGELVIPDSVTEIGLTDNDYYLYDYGTFMNCTGFTRLVLSESLRIVGISSFSGWNQQAGALVIPDSVKTIAQNAFFESRGFTGALELGKSVQFIENSAFCGCSGLTGTLTIPESVREIDFLAFADCSGIESVILPARYVFENESDQGYGVFKGCTSLKDIVIPDGWEKTGRETFTGCSNLVSVVLPDGLKYINSDCFKDCINLSEINMPNGVISIGSQAFSHCERLAEFVFPESLAEIGAGAFSHCTSLTGDLVIPDFVERIPIYTFDSCIGYNNLVIGESVNWIAESAFDNTQFEKMIIKATTPPELKRMMTPNAWHFPVDIPIIVPCGTLDAYQNAEGWSEFTNMHESLTVILSVVSADETAGTVRVLKEATCEDKMVQVEAIPNEGCSFLYWEVNGNQVSTENPYSFELEEDIELVAHFSGVGLEEIEGSVSVYPNPATEKATIDGIEAAEVQVYNGLGQLVKTVQNTNEIHVSDLPQGVYLLRITNAMGVSQTERITVKR